LVGFLHASPDPTRLVLDAPWKVLHFMCLFRTRHPTLRLRQVVDNVYTIVSLASTCHPALLDVGATLPPAYVINSPRIQYQVLAGVVAALDADNGTLALPSGADPLRAQLQFLARSLGFLCVRKGGLLVLSGQGTTGDLPRNGLRNGTRTGPRNGPCPLTYRIRVEPLGVGVYYGFHITGNRRFVLGDFTVTHNTVMSLHILSQLRRKTLIVVNKEFLLNQWIERIGEFLPTARVGRIQGKVVDVAGKDIVIGMLQSLSMKDYPPATFDSFGFTIMDEVHHISSEVFSQRKCDVRGKS